MVSTCTLTAWLPGVLTLTLVPPVPEQPAHMPLAYQVAIYVVSTHILM